MTHASTTALPPLPLTPRLATGPAAPVGEVRSMAASATYYGVGAAELIFMGLLVPLGILAVGSPIVIVVRGLIALITWLVPGA